MERTNTKASDDKIRLVTWESHPDNIHERSIRDIKELDMGSFSLDSEAGRKRLRRKLMQTLGKEVDALLDGQQDIMQLTLERDKF